MKLQNISITLYISVGRKSSSIELCEKSADVFWHLIFSNSVASVRQGGSTASSYEGVLTERLTGTSPTNMSKFNCTYASFFSSCIKGERQFTE